jgi:hypothetical protein
MSACVLVPAAKGVELCLGDGLKAFEQQVGFEQQLCSVIITLHMMYRIEWCAAPAVQL